MKLTNESILEEYNQLDEIEKYQYLIDASSMNSPVQKYNIEKNIIADCASKLWQKELYLYSESRILNGVCFLISYLLKLGIEPTFYKELGLPAIKGLEIAIKKMK